LTGLIERRGRDGKVVDWLDEISVVRAFVQLADDFQKALGLSDNRDWQFCCGSDPGRNTRVKSRRRNSAGHIPLLIPIQKPPATAIRQNTITMADSHAATAKFIV
jgi:hypothetical protein